MSLPSCHLSALLLACALTAGAGAQNDPVITVAGQPFYTWGQYMSSPLFQTLGLHCGRPDRDPTQPGIGYQGPSDCGYSSTNPTSQYEATYVFDIPVVVHVIQRTDGTGFIDAAMVSSQIDVLNEDFGALAGSLGAPGFNSMVQFHLATVDPAGNPTTGITYSTNNTWYNDGGNYWNTLAWDTNKYLNIYTNSASGYLGYVPDLPQGGLVGQAYDRVVILWSAFGRNAPIGAPYNKGRTATHEVGHYLGLEHTFQGGCGSATNCYTTGDLICDTQPESSANYGCNPGSSSCGFPDPVRNYMNYSDDTCMWEFTSEQSRRARCTLEYWRPNLATVIGSGSWVDHGNALFGLLGPPQLAGDGNLLGSDPVSLLLSTARPNTAAWLVLGLSSITAPFKDGVMVPAPDIVLDGLTTDFAGTISLSDTWPAGVPSGFSTFYQYWIQDSAGPVGFSASNGLESITP